MYFTIDATWIVVGLVILYIIGLTYEAWRRNTHRGNRRRGRTINQAFRSTRLIRERETYERWDDGEPVYHTVVTRYLNGDYYHDANSAAHGNASNTPMDRVRGMLK